MHTCKVIGITDGFECVETEKVKVRYSYSEIDWACRWKITNI